MADRPRFTILCATYNQAAYLEESINSVLAQTCNDYEMVIVDDGSTDETPDTLRALLERMPAEQRERFVVQRIANSGQTGAYERGFALSRGEYVCLLDSDDRFLPDKLAVLEGAVREHPDAGLLMHPLRVVDPVGRSTGVVRPQGAGLSSGDIREQMRRNARHSAPGASGLVFRRDVLARLFPAPTKGFPFAADAYLSFGASCLAPVAALPEPLADYRMQPGGQYLRRMLSPDGLRRQVAFQDVVAGHFGLQQAGRRNSFFARNRYALAMFSEEPGTQLRELALLLTATATDPYFGPRQKLVLLAFWLVSFAVRPARFARLWGWFQRRQTGWHLVAADHPPAAHQALG